MEGIVIKVTGSWHDVRLEGGAIIPCRIVGKLRMEDIRTTNPVGVGDHVEIQSEPGDTTRGQITSILSRKITSYVSHRERNMSSIFSLPMWIRLFW